MNKADRLKTIHKLSQATGHLVRLKAEYPTAHTALLTILQFYADMAFKSLMSAEEKDVPLMAQKYRAVHRLLDLLSEVIANPETMHQKFRESLEKHTFDETGLDNQP